MCQEQEGTLEFLCFLGDILARFILVMFVSYNLPPTTPVVVVDGVIDISTQEVPVADGVCVIKIKKESLVWEATLAFQGKLRGENLLVVQLTTEKNFLLVFEQKFINTKNEFLVSCLRANFAPDSQAIADAWDLLHAPAQIQKILKKERRG